MTHALDQTLDLTSIVGTRRLVVLTGMDPSSRQWLEEACRLVCAEHAVKTYADSLPTHPAAEHGPVEVILLQLDSPNEALAFFAWRVFSVHRDLRSMALLVPADTGARAAEDEPLAACIRDHAFWSGWSHLDLSWESLMTNPGAAIRAIGHSLDWPIGRAAEQEIVRRLQGTLATGAAVLHGAQGARDASSARAFDADREREIEERFGWWLGEYGYTLQDRGAQRLDWTIPQPLVITSGSSWFDHARADRLLPGMDLTQRRVLTLCDLGDPNQSYRAFSRLCCLQRQLADVAGVDGFILGDYAGPPLPEHMQPLRLARLEPHRRANRFSRRLISAIRRLPSSFHWFSSIDRQREAVIELFRTTDRVWTDVVLFISDVALGINLIEFMFLFLDTLPQHVVAVLPASTEASRIEIERMRSFGVRVLFDASDYGEPAMRFAGSGLLRSFHDASENPLQPRKAPAVDWAYELASRRFMARRPETILFVHPDWAKCGSATTFSKLSRLFHQRGAIQIDVALQPYRVERDAAYIKKKLKTATPGDLPPALHFELGRRWPLERVARWVLASLTRWSGIKTTAAFVSAFYAQCVSPRWVKSLLRSAQIDYVYLNHYFTFSAAERLRGDLNVLMDTHDVQSTNFVEHNYPAWLGGPAAGFEENLRDEIEVMKRAAMVTMVSQEEIDLVAARQPGLDIFHYIPVPDITPLPPYHDAEFVGPRQVRLLVVASHNPANERSLSWFLTAVWPYVSGSRLSLDIVGTIDRFFLGQTFPYVRFLGLVDDLSEAYARADIVLLPVTNGGGIAIKTLEAIQYEKPLIATAHAFRGLPADLKAEMPLCSDEIELIQDLKRLTQSPEARAARRAVVRQLKRDLAAKHFDAILEERLDRMLTSARSSDQQKPSRASIPGHLTVETLPETATLLRDLERDGETQPFTTTTQVMIGDGQTAIQTNQEPHH